jgi:2'-5' RNA ligase/predicted ABC-type ATPase
VTTPVRPQQPRRDPLEAIGDLMPQRDPLAEIGDAAGDAPPIDDDRPGPYAHDVEALFASAKPKAPLGTMRDVSVTPATATHTAPVAKHPTLGLLAQIGAAPFENPAKFIADNVALLPEAVKVAASPSTRGAGELYRPGTDEPAETGHLAPVAGKEKAVAAAQLAATALGPGARTAIAEGLEPMLGTPAARLVGGSAVGAGTMATFMPEHPYIGAGLGVLGGAFHEIAGYSPSGYPPRESANLADHPDRLLADPTRRVLDPNATTRLVDDARMPPTAPSPPTAPDYTVEPLSSRAKVRPRPAPEAAPPAPPTAPEKPAPVEQVISEATAAANRVADQLEAERRAPQAPVVQQPAPHPAPQPPTPSLLDRMREAAPPPVVAPPSEKSQEKAPTQEPKHEYSSTQIDLPPETAAAIQKLGATIPDEHLAENGRELAPHVTVRYGLRGDDPEAVRALLKDEPPITATLGAVSTFPDSGSGDVVKADVDSPDLHRLNKKLGDALPHSDTHPQYVPHATIAYVKPGLGKQYEGNESLVGHRVTVDHVTFSDRNGQTVRIPLGGARRAQSIDGVRGGAGMVTLPGSGSPEISTEYVVVEAPTLRASHDPFSFAPRADYPANVQGRAYHGQRGTAARQQVELATAQLNPRKMLDPGWGVGGPPVITPDGIVVIGNQRTMMLQRVGATSPEKAKAYREELIKRAPIFGLNADAIAGMQHPVLVRRIADPKVDHTDPNVLREINRLSDTPGTKTKDVLSDAQSRATKLRDAHDALEHFTSTIGPDETIRDYLGSSAGRTFVSKLASDGVIAGQELPRYIDSATQALTPHGKQLIEDMLLAAAVGDADVASRAPSSILRKLEHAVPALVRTSGAGAYDLGPTLRGALDVLHAADVAKLTVREFLDQPDLLGRTFPDAVQRLATFLSTAKKADVTRAFRAYSDAATAALHHGESDDLFGFAHEDPETLAARVFGGAPRVHAIHAPAMREPGARRGALPSEFDTAEIRDARSRANALPTTDRIATPEREAWREQQAVALDNGTRLDRRADLVMGHAGSGKTSTQVEPLVREHGASLLDSDIVKQHAPEWNGGLGAGALHAESAVVRARALARAIARGANIVFPTVGDPTLTPDLVKQLQQAGYTVHAHFVDVPPEISARRMLRGWQEGHRHFVDPVTILQKGDEPRRGYAAVADIPGVIAHEPVDNDVPRGEAPHPVPDWRRQWGFDRLESRAGAVPALESGALRSERSGRTEAGDRGAEGAQPPERQPEHHREVNSEPATSGLESSPVPRDRPMVHAAVAPGGSPRAGRGAGGPASGRRRGASAASAGSAGSASSAALPEPTGLGQPRSRLRPMELVRSIRRIFHPESLGIEARRTAGEIRHETAERFRAYTQAVAALSDLRAHIERQPRARQVEWWDAYEKGRPTGDPLVDVANREFARVTQLRTDELIRLDRFAAERAIENYVGRFWGADDTRSAKNVTAVNNFLGSIFGKRPLEGRKSFLKHRSIEHFVDGLRLIGDAQARIAAGTPQPGDEAYAAMRPATYNYVSSQLAKLAEMERLIGATHMLRAEQNAGRAKPIKLGHEPPLDIDGHAWVKIDREGNDPAFTVYGPPTHTVHEAFDAAVREGLEAAITRLGGVQHTRATSVGRGKLGWATEAGDKMASKFGSHDGVIEHELGHVLDARYGLRAKLAKDPRTRDEMKQLAALRHEGGPAVPEKFRTYVQSPAERIANAIHALIHAPDRMAQIAPVTKSILEDFLKSRKELAPILDIRPSLRLGTATAETRLPGPTVVGHWYAPRASGAVWHAHLSKGLHGNPVYDALTAPGIAATQLLLGFSGFHGTTIATEGMFSDMVTAFDHLVSGDLRDAAKAAGSVVASPVASAISALSPRRAGRLRNLAFGERVMQEYSKPGTHPELSRVIEAMVAGGFRGTAKSELWTGEQTEALKRALKQIVHGDTALERAWAASKIPFDALYAGIELAAAPLMSRFVPLMKTAATYTAVAKRLRDLPVDLPTERLRDEMWDIVREMDLRFGQVQYDNHFINRVAKDLAQAMFLAPGWTFGTLALAARGIRDVAAAPKRTYDRARGKRGKAGANEQPILGRSGKYWVAAVAGTMLLNGILTYWNTGEQPGVHADQWKDYFAFRDGTKDRDGNWNRHTIPGYLMHDIYSWSHHGYETFLNKLSPFFAFAQRVLRNRDFYGDFVYDPEAPLPERMGQVGRSAAKDFLPLSAQNFLEGADRGERGAGEIARNAFGVGPAKREFARSAAQNAMYDILARRGHQARTPDEKEQGVQRGRLLEQLREGAVGRDSVRRLEVAGEMTKREGRSLTSRAKEPHLVALFKQLSVEEAAKVFDLGTSEEQTLWASAYRTKLRNARHNGKRLPQAGQK